MKMKLSHLDEKGRARMVDVGQKDDTRRVAVARATVRMRPETLRMVTEGETAKGDVLQTARLAGIMAAKKTPDLIPLCHPVFISSAQVDLAPDVENSAINIQATVRSYGKTGVEMDALMAVSTAALTVYDMLKSAEKGMVISDILLVEKEGGKSGHYIKDGFVSTL